ncbi:MAG: hypothetical protein WBJ03_12160 [Moraxellaceae bacterium]
MFEHSFFEQKCPGCGIPLEDGHSKLVKNSYGEYSCPGCGIALRLNPKVLGGFVLIAPMLMTTMPYLIAGMRMPSWLFMLALVAAIAGMGIVITNLNYVRK